MGFRPQSGPTTAAAICEHLYELEVMVRNCYLNALKDIRPAPYVMVTAGRTLISLRRAVGGGQPLLEAQLEEFEVKEEEEDHADSDDSGLDTLEDEFLR